jgi:hypothetical protein
VDLQQHGFACLNSEVGDGLFQSNKGGSNRPMTLCTITGDKKNNAAG